MKVFSCTTWMGEKRWREKSDGNAGGGRRLSPAWKCGEARTRKEVEAREWRGGGDRIGSGDHETLNEEERNGTSRCKSRNVTNWREGKVRRAESRRMWEGEGGGGAQWRRRAGGAVGVSRRRRNTRKMTGILQRDESHELGGRGRTAGAHSSEEPPQWKSPDGQKEVAGISSPVTVTVTV